MQDKRLVATSLMCIVAVLYGNYRRLGPPIKEEGFLFRIRYNLENTIRESLI